MLPPSTVKPITVDDAIEFYADSGSTQDRQMEYLTAKGYTSGDLNDRWMQYLTASGITEGSLQDRKRKWLSQTILVLTAKRNRGFSFVPSNVEMTISG